MTSDPRDYKLDISSLAKESDNISVPSPARPYLSVLFDCCKVYQRVYRDSSGTAYRGRCPRCAREPNFPIGQGGTSQRFFRAS